jgi:hypothetical protein
MSNDHPSRETSDIPRHAARHDGAQTQSSGARARRGTSFEGRAERRLDRDTRESLILDGARFWGELARAQLEIDTTRLSRNAAELGRGQAELGLASAERALIVAFREIAALQERVVFLEEQVRSTRAFYVDSMEMNVAAMNVERAALLEEVRMLEAALAAAGDFDEAGK